MAIQHEAAEVVLRVMAQVDNALKGFKQVTRQAKKTQEDITSFGDSFSKQRIAAMNDEAKAYAATQKEMLKECKRTTRSMQKESEKRSRDYKRVAVGGSPLGRYLLGRPRFTKRQADTKAARISSAEARNARFLATNLLSGSALADYNMGSKSGKRFNPNSVKWINNAAKWRKVPISRMAAQMSKGSVNPLSAMAGRVPKDHNDLINRMIGRKVPASAMPGNPIWDARAKAVAPKGKYGPHLPDNWNAMQRARRVGETQVPGMFTAGWQAVQRARAARATAETFVSRGFVTRARARIAARGVSDLPLPMAMQNALNAHRRARMAGAVYGPTRDNMYGPAVQPRGTYGPNISQGQRGVLNARTGNMVNAMYGPVGATNSISDGFKKASKSKDSFASNVFSKMPPIRSMISKVATSVFSIGSGFLRLGLVVPRTFNSISNAIRNSLGNLQAFGTKLRTAGIYTTAAITAPLVAMGMGTVAEGAGFDKAMTESVARAGLGGGGARKIDDKLRGQMETAAMDLALSGSTSFNPTQLAQGYTELAAAGIEATHLLTTLPIVARLAQAGEMDLAKTTNALTTTMGALGVTTESLKDPVAYAKAMTEYSDVMVTVANMTQASVESVAQSMTSDAGPAAKAYGMNIKELGALIGIYAEKGIKGAKAGNMAGRALRLVTSSFTRNKGIWQRAGIEIADATGKWLPFNEVVANLTKKLDRLSNVERTELLKKLGLRDLSQKSLEPLLGTADAFKRLMDEMDRGGQTRTMAAIQMEAFSNQILVMWNHISAIKIDLFKILAPYLLAAAEAVNQLAKAFRELSPETKKSIILVLAALASIGPILLGLGTMVALIVAGFSLLGFILAPIAALLSPIGLVVVALTTLGIMWLSTMQIDIAGIWNRASVALNQFARFSMGFMQNFGPNMMIMWEWLKAQLARFSEWSKETLDFIGIRGIKAADGMLAAFGNFFVQAFGFIANFKENMTSLFGWLIQSWPEIVKTWEVSLDHFGMFAVRAFLILGETLKNAIIPVLTFIAKFVSDMFGNIALDLMAMTPGAKWNIVVVQAINKRASKERDEAIKEFTDNPTVENDAKMQRRLVEIERNRKEQHASLKRGEGTDFAGAFLHRLNVDQKKAQQNPFKAIQDAAMEEVKGAQGQFPKLGLPGLNLQAPNLQGPQFRVADPNLFFPDGQQNNGGVAANNTKLFEMMLVAMQSMNQNDGKKPKIVLAPAGLS